MINRMIKVAFEVEMSKRERERINRLIKLHPKFDNQKVGREMIN